MAESIQFPDEVPVMPLPGALLFPHALLPLHIFEPRYRAMLEHALREQRMFSVALIRSQRSQWKSTDDFFHVAGVGLIRACVGRNDGTSDLILQGLRRVRFTGFQQSAPFPIARIEPLESDATTSVETDALGAKVLELYSKLKDTGRQLPQKVDQYLSHLGDTEMLADLMAATFINDPLRRQQVLEELSLNQRLRLVIQYLREETGTAAA
ncbi:MAG TPA: LON peptidase substrate-binding domain-containing protein [Chthoniobacterales bacterium]|nr:LON peptidase substrate-binding domain-containing protein [Chthoniobacterales bacterium]